MRPFRCLRWVYYDQVDVKEIVTEKRREEKGDMHRRVTHRTYHPSWKVKGGQGWIPYFFNFLHNVVL